MMPLSRLVALTNTLFCVFCMPHFHVVFAFPRLRAIPRHLLPQPRIPRRAPCCKPRAGPPTLPTKLALSFYLWHSLVSRHHCPRPTLLGFLLRPLRLERPLAR